MQTLGDKTTIDDIYERMPKKYAHLKNREIELEIQNIYINPEVKDIYDFALAHNKKIVFTSNMYLSKDILGSILRSNGITKFDGLYISCDYGYDKSSGQLIRRVLSDLHIDANRTIHVGDDYNADVNGGRLAGVCTVYYPKISDVFFEENAFAKSFANKYKGNKNVCFFLGSLALSYHLNKCRYGDSMWNRIGCLITSLTTYTYALAVKNTCRKLGKKRIILALRDGYIIGKTADVLLGDLKTTYVYGSRIMSKLIHDVYVKKTNNEDLSKSE